MSTLSQAIIEARKRHEAEIEARLRRRRERQENQLRLLNQGQGTDPAIPDTAAADLEPVAPAREIPVPPPAPPVAESTRSPGPAPSKFKNETSLVVENKEDYIDTSVLQYNSLDFEKETSPSSNFTKVSNIVIDGLKRHLTSTYFSVYVEIYRQTIGRGKNGAWLRTREIQKACGLGSDTTVRKAIFDLEEKGLLRLDKNRRVGSPKGLFISVLSVEKAIARLDKKAEKRKTNDMYLSTEVPHQKLPQYFSKNYRGTSVFSNEVHDIDIRHEDMKTSSSGDFRVFLENSEENDDGDDVSLESTITLLRERGLSPSAIPFLIEKLTPTDFKLIPYLLRQLDQTTATKNVKNPAGLLRVWLEGFESWRPELKLLLERDREAEKLRRMTSEKGDLRIEWYEYAEREVERLRSELPEADLNGLKEEGRKEIEKLSPASKGWDETIWAESLEGWILRKLEARVLPWEQWLESKSGFSDLLPENESS